MIHKKYLLAILFGVTALTGMENEIKMARIFLGIVANKSAHKVSVAQYNNIYGFGEDHLNCPVDAGNTRQFNAELKSKNASLYFYRENDTRNIPLNIIIERYGSSSWSLSKQDLVVYMCEKDNVPKRISLDATDSVSIDVELSGPDLRVSNIAVQQVSLFHQQSINAIKKDQRIQS